MVNTGRGRRADGTGPLPLARVLVIVYVAIVFATLVALIALSIVTPAQATANAWGHAVIVAVFAVLLPLRLRSTRSGRRNAVRAVGVIAAVLFLVNVVEALIPSFVPLWMRVEMVGVALVMAGVVFDVARWAARDH
jgi:hypothetical protein